MSQLPRLNIVILGASFAGISVVHNLVEQALPELEKSHQFSYRIILVSPSTHLYWNISAPRAIVSTSLIYHEESFIPISRGLDRYGPDLLEHVQGTATALDIPNSTVTISRVANDDGREPLESPASGPVSPASPAATLVGKISPTVASYLSNTTGSVNPGHSKGEFTLPYHALIIATGSTAHSSMLSLRGPHTNTLNSLTAFQSKLPTADSVVVAGGGPSGVETAGQIAYWYNQPEGPKLPRWSSTNPLSFLSREGSLRRGPHAKKVILLGGAHRLLPNIDPVAGQKALKQLSALGVRVILNMRVTAANFNATTGKTTLRLSNDTTVTCDLYVPCTGVRPNTEFLPKDSPLLRNGYIATTPAPSTLRVDVPAELTPSDRPETEEEARQERSTRKASDSGYRPRARVYGIGDCAAYSANCILDIYSAMPVLINNIKNDLLAYQLYMENPYGGNRDRIEELQLQDMEYVKDERDSQVVPIGYKKPGGVGVVYGHRLPSLMVYLAKGKRYKLDAAQGVVDKGLSPY